jgi:hypothetical protein
MKPSSTFVSRQHPPLRISCSLNVKMKAIVQNNFAHVQSDVSNCIFRSWFEI